MSTISAKLKAVSGKYFPRRIVRNLHQYIPFEIYGNGNNDVVGFVYLNKASLVGSGGTTFTITDGTSSITVTE